jgi:DNA-binding transcriptional LysR family regulator
VDLLRLRVLCEVVERRSFSRAAEALALSQPAVSFHVKGLEQELGLPLVLRERGRVGPTEAGALVYQQAREILQQCEELRRAALELREARAGRVVLGASDTIGSFLLPPRIAAFRRAHPAAQLTMIVSTTAAICEQVLRGDVDFGYVEGLAIPPELAIEPIHTEPLVLIAPATHPLARHGTLQGHALAGEPFVHSMPGTAYRQMVERWLQAAGIGQPPVAAEVGSTTALKLAVEAGLGITLCFRCSVERELAEGRIAQLLVAQLQSGSDFSLVYRPRKYFSPLARRFLAALRQRG